MQHAVKVVGTEERYDLNTSPSSLPGPGQVIGVQFFRKEKRKKYKGVKVVLAQWVSSICKGDGVGRALFQVVLEAFEVAIFASSSFLLARRLLKAPKHLISDSSSFVQNR